MNCHKAISWLRLFADSFRCTARDESGLNAWDERLHCLTACEIWTRFDVDSPSWRLACSGVQLHRWCPSSRHCFVPFRLIFVCFQRLQFKSRGSVFFLRFFLGRGGHLNQNWCDVKLTDELCVHSLLKCNLWLPKMKFHLGFFRPFLCISSIWRSLLVLFSSVHFIRP